MSVFSSRRRHTRFDCDWSSDGALPILLRALRERGIVPDLIAGTSIGALIGAAHAGGVGDEKLSQRAISLRRRDLFRLNHIGMRSEERRVGKESRSRWSPYH